MDTLFGVFRSLRFILSGHSGKTLLLLGIGACVYQLYYRWRSKHLISTKFRGQVVLITGASSGLGEGEVFFFFPISLLLASTWFEFNPALARVFYAAGSKVILASRNFQKLQQLKFQLDNDPRREVGVQV